MKKFSSITRVSSRRTSRNKKYVRIFLTGCVLFVFLLLVPRIIGVTVAVAVVPILHFETLLANLGAQMPDFFKDRVTLLREVNELQKRLAYETVTEATTASLVAENQSLRRLLGAGETQRIAASVIGRPTVTPYDVLVIDKGAADGIEQYAPVYVGFGQAIGYVAESFQTSAVIALVSTPGFETTVYIYGPNIYTNARGLGGGVLEVSVPQGVLLQVGDPVVVPTLGAGVYGVIEVVNSVPTEPEQRGYVTTQVPLQSLRFVSVGTAAVSPISFTEATKVVDRVKKDLTKVPVPSGVLVEIVQDVATTTAPVENGQSVE